MQRDIRFRAWDKEEHIMYEVNLIDWPNKEIVPWHDVIDNESDAELDSLPFERIELMQYTGLKDKNRKDVYEGDIVEWDDNSNGKWRRRCEIVYTPAHYRLVGYYYNITKPEVHNPIEFDCGAFIYEKETEKELEVIGNVHKHPDLLK